LILLAHSPNSLKIKEPREMVSQGDSMAEDMGLEEVRIVQTLKFQGGKAPSMFVPGVVPNR
jgi:hypothetical protein